MEVKDKKEEKEEIDNKDVKRDEFISMKSRIQQARGSKEMISMGQH